MIRIIIKKIILNSKKKIKGYNDKSTTNLKIKGDEDNLRD